MHSGVAPCETASAAELEASACRKVAWRILPVLLLGYSVSFLDRINIGFARPHMLDDLGFSEAAFGLGAGLFFVGYLLFEIPSNLILRRIGARFWLSCIMMAWGVVSAATAFVQASWQFHCLRFLLGIAEAGFYPGVIFHLTQWFPQDRRQSRINTFQAGVPLAGIAGAPLSGWILEHYAGAHGLAGWQWLLILEALPTLPIAVAFWLMLTNRIAEAQWLTPAERLALDAALAREEAGKGADRVWSAFSDPAVWRSCLIGILISTGIYGLGFYLPTLIARASAANPTQIGLWTAIPYIAVAACLVLLGLSADARKEHRWHACGAATLGAAALALALIFGDELAVALPMLSLAAGGIMSALPLGWGLFVRSLRGNGAAAAIALIASIGGLGGFIAPFLIGRVTDATRSPDAALYLIAAAVMVGGLLFLLYPKRQEFPHDGSR